MEKFEIHITGDGPNIIDILNSLDIKSLHAEMRSPENQTIQVEYMSSFTKLFYNYELCKEWVNELVNQLEELGIKILRVKIECPYFYSHYKERAIYLEAHFPTPILNLLNQLYPYVYNVNSKKYVSTERIFNKNLFGRFIDKYKQIDSAEIEYCLFDDNIRHGEEWIRLFKQPKY